jgi:hypothetical protein
MTNATNPLMRNAGGANRNAPAVRVFYERVPSADASTRAQERLAWVVVVVQTVVLEHGYWILVAPSARQWGRSNADLQKGLLTVVWDLTKALGVSLPELSDHLGVETYAEPLWIWALLDPSGHTYLMSHCQRQTAVAWKRVPTLNPAHTSGTRDALRCWFPDESVSALSTLDSVLSKLEPGTGQFANVGLR